MREESKHIAPPGISSIAVRILFPVIMRLPEADAAQGFARHHAAPVCPPATRSGHLRQYRQTTATRATRARTRTPCLPELAPAQSTQMRRALLIVLPSLQVL